MMTLLSPTPPSPFRASADIWMTPCRKIKECSKEALLVVYMRKVAVYCTLALVLDALLGVIHISADAKFALVTFGQLVDGVF